MQQIWDSVKPSLERWTGKRLIEVAVFGIRIFYEGAIVATRKISQYLYFPLI